MTQVRDDLIPEELSAVVRDAAGAVPDAAHGLERVRRRRRVHRRRTATRLALVGVVVAAVAVAIPVALRPAPAPGPAVEQILPAQRLFFDAPSTGEDTSVVALGKRVAGGAAVGVRVPSGLVEIDDSGEAIVHKTPGPEVWLSNVVGLPDGGLAAFGVRDRQPGAVKPDNTAVMDMEDVLTVVAPDGSVRVDRALGTADGKVSFVGATGEAAYLLRGDQLVRHALTSGQEQAVGAAERVRALIADGWSVDFVGSDRVVLKKESEEGVRATVLDLSGAGDPDTALVCTASCAHGTRLMLAPGGRFIAYVYTAATGGRAEPMTGRLTITDLSTGERVVERDLASDVRLGGLDGLIGWIDAHTLRLGLIPLPAGADRVYELREILKLETIKV